MVEEERACAGIARDGTDGGMRDECSVTISWLSLVDAVKAALCVLDLEGRILHFNAHSEQLLCRQVRQVAGCEFADTILPSAERPFLRSALDQIRGGADSCSLRCSLAESSETVVVGVAALRRRHGLEGILLTFEREGVAAGKRIGSSPRCALARLPHQGPLDAELDRRHPAWPTLDMPKPGPAPVSNGTARILVVEDNPTNQLVAVGILRKLGYAVGAVDNGVEAVKTLELITYDLVLMDLEMPELDGFETTRFLRVRGSDALNHAIPIVAMSAHATPTDKRKCLEVGMNDHLAKPITPESVAAIVDKWLPNGDRTRSAASYVSESKLAVVRSRALEQQAPSPEPSVPVFIEAALIERLLDDRSLAWSIVQGFLADIPIQIQALQRELELGNAIAACQQAHRIKGAAATVNAEALRRAASDFERAGAAQDRQAMSDGLLELRRQFARLETAMNGSSLAAATTTAVRHDAS